MAPGVASVLVPQEPVLLKDILASPSPCGNTAVSARHLFGNGVAPPRSSDDGIKDAAADRHGDRDLSIPKIFTGDVLDLLDDAARLDLMLALTGDGGAASMAGFSARGWWVSKEDGDAVQLKVPMPGLGKEHVKMRVEKDALVIKGEAGKDLEGDDDKGPARYSYRIGLSSQAFKMDQIKADMKNGVLRVTVPKIKDEERKDVFEIKID